MDVSRYSGRGELCTNGVATVWRNDGDCKVGDMSRAIGLGHLDDRPSGCAAVPIDNGAPSGIVPVEARQSDGENRRLDLVESRVHPACDGDVVLGVPSVLAEQPDTMGHFGKTRHDCAPVSQRT